MTIDEARRLAKKQLSPARYRHTENVADAARRLACRWGAEPQKAELAGWLHDIVKEKGRDALLQILAEDAIMAQLACQKPPPVWHGLAAAVYAKNTLGVADDEVCAAIACHTTGKAGMALLDKVVFLADVISAERSFRWVRQIRELAGQNLDAAVAEAMRRNISFIKAKGKPLDADTLAALDSLAGGPARGGAHP